MTATMCVVKMGQLNQIFGAARAARAVLLRVDGVLQLHDRRLVHPPCLQHEVQGMLLAREGNTGILLMTGLEVTEANRPRVPLSQQMFEPIMDAKRTLADLQPMPNEVRYLERMLIKAGSAGAVAPDAGISSERVKALHRASATVQSLATSVSRLPQFPRRFTEAVLGSLVPNTSSV